jgi:hypothetical protein
MRRVTMRSGVSHVVNVDVVEWGPGWYDMQVAARELGARGLMFRIKWSTPEDQARGVDILPEIHLYDSRFRVHVATPGLFIVIHPGRGNFRILDKTTLEQEYAVRTDDTADRA